ncbi:MAG: hypothetical protein H6Q25_1572 [Bacteroidetes bacterium]|nr:hypothetical protein [Bacteroidota bacterium]
MTENNNKKNNNLKKIKTMKKIQFLFVILLALVMVSCMDQEDNTLNTTPTTNTGSITCEEHDHGSISKGWFSGKVQVGHTADQCNNSCVRINGKDMHIDCQGVGHYCSITAKLTLNLEKEGIYTATTIDPINLTSLDLFNMPNRSLYGGLDANNMEQWLNIPAQVSYRDSLTKQFSFTEVFITDKPFYPNL